MADLARIKANVAKMAAQNAPEEDIDGYIASEGVTVDDVRNFRGPNHTDQLLPTAVGLPEGYNPETGTVERGKTNSFLHGAADMATWGFGDELSSGIATGLDMLPGMRGQSYDQNLAQIRAQQEHAAVENPGTHLAGQLAGAMAVPSKAVASLPRAIGTGAVAGGLYGLGSGEGSVSERLPDALAGVGVGAGGGAAGSLIAKGISKGVHSAAGVFNKKPPVPTVTDWKAKADTAFTRMRGEGVVFTKHALSDLETKLNTYLSKRGYWPDNQPGIRGGLEMIKDYKSRGGLMTPDGLMALRQRFSGGYVVGNKNNNAMVREAINLIDDLLKNPKRGFVAASGDPKRASAAYREGMSASRTQHKLEDVEYLVNKGQRQGDRNIIDNANKRVKSLLSDKLLDERSPMSRGWNAAEKEAIRKASRWTPGERIAHAASGAAPQGKLTGAAHLAMAVANAATGNLPGLAIQAAGAGAGWASGKAADAMAKKSVAELARLIANGGVPPATVENVVQRLAKSKRDALTRALMMYGIARGSAVYGPQAQGQQP